MPVPQTDTGGQVENTKASERTVVKELGKMAPVTSGEGAPGRVMRTSRPQSPMEAAVTRPKRLFTKNTAAC